MLTPRVYQESGIDYGLRKKKYMLADDPGLGKTYQASEVIFRADAFPCVIFTPGHLVDQWAKHLQAQYGWAGKTVSYAHKADFYLRDWALQKHADFYVANIEMLRQVSNFNWPQKIKSFVFDESHHLKNKDSKQAQGARTLIFTYKPEYVIAISATPIKREADDLYMQLHILRPDVFTKYKTFVDTFCEKEETPWGTKVIGVHDKTGLLKLLEGIILRRSYNEVGMELPDLIESIVPVEFTEAQRTSYETLKHELILKVADFEEEIPYMWAIQALQTLRRMTATDDKIEAICDIALEAELPVIFTHYKDTAKRIAEQLKVPAITGEIPAEKRQEIAKAQKIVVCTIDSMTEGVDLSHMQTVIFAEEDYTPGSNYQALSRVRRFGARLDKPIIKYCVHIEDSIDEHIHGIAEKRYQTATGILADVIGVAPKDLIKAS